MRGRNTKNQKGSALFMTVMILASIMTVSFAASSIITPGILANRSQVYSVKAYYAAESGAERILWEVRKNGFGNTLPASNQNNIVAPVTLGNGAMYNIDYATSSPIVTFTCRGTYSGSRRSVQLSY